MAYKAIMYVQAPHYIDPPYVVNKMFAKFKLDSLSILSLNFNAR